MGPDSNFLPREGGRQQHTPRSGDAIAMLTNPKHLSGIDPYRRIGSNARSISHDKVIDSICATGARSSSATTRSARSWVSWNQGAADATAAEGGADGAGHLPGPRQPHVSPRRPQPTVDDRHHRIELANTIHDYIELFHSRNGGPLARLRSSHLRLPSQAEYLSHGARLAGAPCRHA